MPVPVPRRSQKMFKPEFFEQLKKTREASDAAWDVSEWFSRVRLIPPSRLEGQLMSTLGDAAGVWEME